MPTASATVLVLASSKAKALFEDDDVAEAFRRWSPHCDVDLPLRTSQSTVHLSGVSLIFKSPEDYRIAPDDLACGRAASRSSGEYVSALREYVFSRGTDRYNPISLRHQPWAVLHVVAAAETPMRAEEEKFFNTYRFDKDVPRYFVVLHESSQPNEANLANFRSAFCNAGPQRAQALGVSLKSPEASKESVRTYFKSLVSRDLLPDAEKRLRQALDGVAKSRRSGIRGAFRSFFVVDDSSSGQSLEKSKRSNAAVDHSYAVETRTHACATTLLSIGDSAKACAHFGFAKDDYARFPDAYECVGHVLRMKLDCDGVKKPEVVATEAVSFFEKCSSMDAALAAVELVMFVFDNAETLGVHHSKTMELLLRVVAFPPLRGSVHAGMCLLTAAEAGGKIEKPRKRGLLGAMAASQFKRVGLVDKARECYLEYAAKSFETDKGWDFASRHLAVQLGGTQRLHDALARVDAIRGTERSEKVVLDAFFDDLSQNSTNEVLRCSAPQLLDSRFVFAAGDSDVSVHSSDGVSVEVSFRNSNFATCRLSKLMIRCRRAVEDDDGDSENNESSTFLDAQPGTKITLESRKVVKTTLKFSNALPGRWTFDSLRFINRDFGGPDLFFEVFLKRPFSVTIHPDAPRSRPALVLSAGRHVCGEIVKATLMLDTDLGGVLVSPPDAQLFFEDLQPIDSLGLVHEMPRKIARLSCRVRVETTSARFKLRSPDGLVASVDVVGVLDGLCVSKAGDVVTKSDPDFPGRYTLTMEGEIAKVFVVGEGGWSVSESSSPSFWTLEQRKSDDVQVPWEIARAMALVHARTTLKAHRRRVREEQLRKRDLDEKLGRAPVTIQDVRRAAAAAGSGDDARVVSRPPDWSVAALKEFEGKPYEAHFALVAADGALRFKTGASIRPDASDRNRCPLAASFSFPRVLTTDPNEKYRLEIVVRNVGRALDAANAIVENVVVEVAHSKSSDSLRFLGSTSVKVPDLGPNEEFLLHFQCGSPLVPGTYSLNSVRFHVRGTCFVFPHSKRSVACVAHKARTNNEYDDDDDDDEDDFSSSLAESVLVDEAEEAFLRSLEEELGVSAGDDAADDDDDD